MYTFCKVFHCTPEEYNNQSIEDIDVLLEIHKEVKKMEEEENKRKSRMK